MPKQEEEEALRAALWEIVMAMPLDRVLFELCLGSSPFAPIKIPPKREPLLLTHEKATVAAEMPVENRESGRQTFRNRLWT